MKFEPHVSGLTATACLELASTTSRRSGRLAIYDWALLWRWGLLAYDEKIDVLHGLLPDLDFMLLGGERLVREAAGGNAGAVLRHFASTTPMSPLPAVISEPSAMLSAPIVSFLQCLYEEAPAGPTAEVEHGSHDGHPNDNVLEETPAHRAGISLQLLAEAALHLEPHSVLGHRVRH